MLTIHTGLNRLGLRVVRISLTAAGYSLRQDHLPCAWFVSEPTLYDTGRHWKTCNAVTSCFIEDGSITTR